MDSETIARALIERTLAGDVEGVGALYHDDARVWRNFDAKAIGKAQLLKVIGYLGKKVGDLRYEDVRIQTTPTGFVQQHVFAGTSPGGQPFSAHTCLVARLREGEDGQLRIARLDEYLDSKALAPLLG